MLFRSRAIEASPQSLDPHVHMETVLVRSLNRNAEHDRDIYKEIADVDSELLTIDPFVPFARKNLASAYYSLGHFDHALLELQKAIEYEPNYVPAYLQLSTWYRDMGNASESQEYQNKAVAIVLKYRDFRPQEPYEGLLLGRPEQSFLPKNPKQKPTS